MDHAICLLLHRPPVDALKPVYWEGLSSRSRPGTCALAGLDHGRIANGGGFRSRASRRELERRDLPEIMIRITQAGIAARPDAVDQLRAEFAATGCAMLPGFLSPPVLRVLTKQLEKGRFEVTEEVGRESGHVLGT